ncbi:hypothetical protein B0H14DRAFT_2562622 [Mycena olivaceomarginata]|nr:hypothetical protein B0H14DRAFT_2562622 [Mycena olivaceomarginata]
MQEEGQLPIFRLRIGNFPQLFSNVRIYRTNTAGGKIVIDHLPAEHQNLFTLTQAFVNGTKCRITNALCGRIALMALATMRDVANGSDDMHNEHVPVTSSFEIFSDCHHSLFEDLITVGKELHGAVDIVYQTSNDIQQEVDDLINASSANVARRVRWLDGKPPTIVSAVRWKREMGNLKPLSQGGNEAKENASFPAPTIGTRGSLIQRFKEGVGSPSTEEAALQLLQSAFKLPSLVVFFDPTALPLRRLFELREDTLAAPRPPKEFKLGSHTIQLFVTAMQIKGHLALLNEFAALKAEVQSVPASRDNLPCPRNLSPEHRMAWFVGLTVKCSLNPSPSVAFLSPLVDKRGGICDG